MVGQYNELCEFLDIVKANPKRKRALSIGDSWFQYPLRSYGDIQRRLRKRFKNDLIFLDDSYPGRDADEVPRLLPNWTSWVRHMSEEEKKPFNLFLLSLGGNDIIGKDFFRHIKSADDPADGLTWQWNTSIPDVAYKHLSLRPLGKSFDVIRRSYKAIIALRDAYADGATIITHTYADVTPCRQPYKFLTYRNGPWLWKPMRSVGLVASADQRELSRWLLESFAYLLEDIQSTTSKFVVLDTRKELPDYDGWWDNEIHPLGKGFERLVKNHWAPAVTSTL